MTKGKINIWIFLLIALQALPSMAMAKSSFFEDSRYRGFYWFETKLKNDQQANKTKEYKMPSPEEAEQLIVTMKKRLDDSRNQMIAVGLDPEAPMDAKRKAIIAYKKLDVAMWGGAVDMARASEMGNFTNPEIANLAENPTNVAAIKLKKKLDEEKDKLSILKVAEEFDLVFFAEDSCISCQQFAPVLREFAVENNFNIEVTSIAGEAGLVARKLGITSVPTVVLVKKDNTQVFELSRGLASLSQLRKNTILAKQYSDEMNKMNRQKK
jgi:thiol-disulfide isomerase/thioredoxin